VGNSSQTASPAWPERPLDGQLHEGQPQQHCWEGDPQTWWEVTIFEGWELLTIISTLLSFLEDQQQKNMQNWRRETRQSTKWSGKHPRGEKQYIKIN